MSIWRFFGLAILVAPLAMPTARATELRVLTQPLAPFTTGPQEALSGFAVEIVAALLKQTGDVGAMTMEPFPRMLRDVETGPMTLGFVVARTPPREKLMQWVGPLAVNGVYLYKKAGSPVSVTTLEQARTLGSIGVTREDADHRFLREKGFTNFDISESQAIDLKKLQLGRLDVTPMGEMVFAASVAANGLKVGDFEKTPVKLYESAVYIAFSPDVPAAVIASWSHALQSLKASGEYAKILMRDGIDPEPTLRAGD